MLINKFVNNNTIFVCFYITKLDTFVRYITYILVIIDLIFFELVTISYKIIKSVLV